jgi:soluble lytic murein transglycosylase-like protein
MLEAMWLAAYFRVGSAHSLLMGALLAPGVLPQSAFAQTRPANTAPAVPQVPAPGKPLTAPATAPVPPKNPKPPEPPSLAQTAPAGAAPAAAPPATTARPNPAQMQREAMARQRTAAEAQRNATSAQAESMGIRMAAFGVHADAAEGAGPPECDPIEESVVTPIVEAAAQASAVDAKLVRAVMEQESAMLPCALSPKGAQGLMQLMPATAEQLGVKDPFDPTENVGAGTRYLKQLLDKYGGDLLKTLSAYNAGPGATDAADGAAQNAETQAYVGAIMKRLGK